MSNRLISLFAEVLKVSPDSLNYDSSPNNTPEWDSLAAMNLVSLLENTFNIELSTKEIMKMRTIGIAREVLRSRDIDDI